MEKISDVSVKELQNGRFVKPYFLSYTQNEVKKSWELVSVHSSVSILIFNTDRKKLVFVKQFRPAVYFCHYERNKRELSSEVKKVNLESPQETLCNSKSQGNQTIQHGSLSQETQTTGVNQKVPAATSNNSTYSCQSTQSDCIQQNNQGTQHDNLCRDLPALPGALGVTIELCAGIVDKTCDIKETAKAEILEECGYDVSLSSIQEIITYRTGVGMEGERQTMFYVEVTDAMKISSGGGLASEGEMIEVVEMSVGEAKTYLEEREVSSTGGLLFAVMWFMTNKAT